jgi:hypothetical protein
MMQGAAALLLLTVLMVAPTLAEWRLIARSTGVVATHAVHLPRSSNVLVWGRLRSVSATAVRGELGGMGGHKHQNFLRRLPQSATPF